MSEPTRFPYAIYEATWNTFDMNADVGRIQHTQLDVTNKDFLITSVTLSFPLLNHVPRRTCTGTTRRTATVLDVMLADTR